MLRPAALRLWSAPAEGRLRASVRSTSFLGGVVRHHVRVGELPLVVDQPLSDMEDVSPEMWLAVDTARLHVLPAEAA